MKILIADDHALVRRGIRALLADAFPGSTFTEAGDYVSAIDLASKDECDVAIVDLALGDRHGLEVVYELNKIRRNLPIIVLSFNSPANVAARCFRAGASSYLSKSDSLDQIVEAIRTVVVEGKRFITPAVMECLAEEIVKPTDREGHNLLSAREISVLLLIASGKQLTHIAKSMNISVKTVSTYRARILRKMGSHSNAELTRYVLDHNL